MVTWLKDRAEYAKLIEKYDTFLFDCDGVLWNGEQVVQGAAEVMDICDRSVGYQLRT
jgi:4-nitrophenyl phosphatase